MSTEGIDLRPVDDTHRTALLDLWVEAWTAAMSSIDFSARRDWFDRRLDDLATSGAILTGAFDATATLLGFVLVDPTSGELDQLCVAQRAQGSGLASRLINAAQTLSPRGLTLMVNLDNPRALRFYEREGFTRGEESINPLSGLRIVTMLWRPTPPP